MTSISPGAALAIWGPRTPLFEKFSYRNRLSDETCEAKPEPVTEFREALVMLYEQMNDHSKRFIDTDAELPDKTRGPAICIEIYASGYGKCEFTRSHTFPITKELFRELKESGLVSGTPQWGYTDETKLKLNERSTQRLLDEIEKFEEAPASA